MKKNERRATVKVTPTPAAATDESTAKRNQDFDFDKRVADQVDWSIWRAIYNGEFKLATKCRRCGRWLTDGRSKRHGLGATCAAKMSGADQ